MSTTGIFFRLNPEAVDLIDDYESHTLNIGESSIIRDSEEYPLKQILSHQDATVAATVGTGMISSARIVAVYEPNCNSAVSGN